MPTISATPPPTPLSTSSKTIVGIRLPSLAMTWIARLIRDSSPPDAIFESGCGSWPGFGADQEFDIVGAGCARQAALVGQYADVENTAGHPEIAHGPGLPRR